MIIGMCGPAGSGKDTAADYLVEKHGFVKIALADPLKRFCREVFDFSTEQMWGPSEMRNKPDERYLRWTAKIPHMLSEEELKSNPTGEVPQYLTPRHALQQLGTEWGRECYPDVWVEYALRTARKILEGQGYNTRTGLNRMGWEGDFTPKGVVISDVRFLNEVDAINKAGGFVFRLQRKGAQLEGAAGQHQSEQEMNTIPEEKFRLTIQNDYSLEDLYVGLDVSLQLVKASSSSF